jgi:glucose-6-phosphate dehydrogenase assembly protein OpcA
MTAGFFDHAFCSGTLSSISGLDIQANSATGFSSEALMFAAWLASRLHWTHLSEGNNVLLMDADGKQVRIRIFVRPPAPNGARGIAAVTLRADSPAVTFHMALDAETKYLRGTVEMECARPAVLTSRLGASEGEFLAGELEILGPDRIYETTINILERIM